MHAGMWCQQSCCMQHNKQAVLTTNRPAPTTRGNSPTPNSATWATLQRRRGLPPPPPSPAYSLLHRSKMCKHAEHVQWHKCLPALMRVAQPSADLHSSMRLHCFTPSLLHSTVPQLGGGPHTVCSVGKELPLGHVRKLCTSLPGSRHAQSAASPAAATVLACRTAAER